MHPETTLRNLGFLKRKAVATEVMIKFLVYSIQAAVNGVADVFLPSRLQAVTNNGRFRTNEGILEPVP